MIEKTGFFETIWRRLRPHALTGAIETGEYVILWMVILFAHLIEVLAAGSGIDPSVITWVALMEKWVWIASFASFFLRVLIRLWRNF